MAIKTFTTGEVLTASDTNTYLANSGLVYVTSAIVGSGVSSVTVSNAFNSTFDNYRIQYTGGVASTATSISMIFGSTTNNYYGSIVFCDYSSSSASAIGTNNGSSMPYIGGGDSLFAAVNLDVLMPNLAKSTIVSGQFQNSTALGTASYRLSNTTQYTAFTITGVSGTLTGGTITVYGYRKA